ncbi:hypothetical protein acsn021_24680 [Anaerocolumna cellulosilytica]|uniref:Uncharacterized protein n=1 Tax=Anaerocolumna cellulosilytica TaxID=433286 RepID=A0A6S6R0P8_9FIRM|nr:hypothetical protein [Anaerocolumna cellulosilytica]MBB5193885.1 hypothetical protein [Anaerocolumna cellulosilytica]BCJ94899.1 hypothetical protein acsn021_24680 [Anaerocolumna cellulosilytica]
MKLKYKKMILMVTVCTMGIGMVTFSVTRENSKSSTAVESKGKDLVVEKQDLKLDSSTADVLSAAALNSLIPSTEGSNLEIATLQGEQDTNVLEKDAYTDVNELITKYLNAKLTNKKSDYKSLVNDVSLLDLKDIERKTKYIENYENITCYTKKGPEDGSFVVFAYHEIKFNSIDTLAPAMNRFYVKQNEEGKPYIYLGEADKETEVAIAELSETEDVLELIESVNTKLAKAVEKDGPLGEFYLKLEESAKDVSKNE